MARTKSKKEPVSGLASQTSSSAKISGSPNPDSSTETLINQAEIDADGGGDERKGRHFWYVVYPTEDYVRQHCPECQYDGSDGWGQAPDDWIERLQDTGLAFHVSPLHWQDVQLAEGVETAKKPHWHVIVSWGNTTTYRTAKALCRTLGDCPRPQLLHNATGAYRYAWHLDNPEKYQYDRSEGRAYNGWSPPLDTTEVMRIKREIKEMVLLEDIQEYAELLIVCDTKGAEYFDVACNNTFYCEKLCASYRHNPIRVLMRYYGELPEGELKDEVKARIERGMTDEGSGT